MTPQISSYLDNAARFSAVVDGAANWSSASPCNGWTGADVLDHVIDTQRDFLAQRGCDLGPRPAGFPADVWHSHLEAVRRVVADDDLVLAEYDGYFGRTTLAATLADFYGFDLIAHRWDLGRATGREVAFSGAEMDTMETAIAGFGESLYMDGICARPVAVPQDATRQQRILATLGRQSGATSARVQRTSRHGCERGQADRVPRHLLALVLPLVQWVCNGSRPGVPVVHSLRRRLLDRRACAG